jgi:uncharacterized protein
MTKGPQPNKLISETSPYLLQHAYNPVDWHPWGQEALNKALKEDKPIILSIGYSACHWCHVMEHESFENEAIAQLMNDHYVCIKVDREERPDVDQVYMDAVQAMGLNGGWPLNVFLTPEQKPFYGGTYFPPKNWAGLLGNIAEAFIKQRQELEDSAEKFADHLGGSVLEQFSLSSPESSFSLTEISSAASRLIPKFDTVWGGLQKAPKFPMPSIWLFLLRHGHVTNNQQLVDHVHFTLIKMAQGGIYDQAGGGFARYSVDGEWFAPHFEKMLYDNAQLLSLYSEAYQVTDNPLFKEVVYQTVEWLEREMLHEEGGFYAALDADSEGVEGKFYTWTQPELEEIAGDQKAFIKDYYNISDSGNWEHGRNILFVTDPIEVVAKRHQLPMAQAKQAVAAFNEQAMQVRASRIRPGLDDKILTGWNGLMIKGLANAAIVFKEDLFGKLATNAAVFIKSKAWSNGVLHRTYKNGECRLYGYLEDYAATIDGFVNLYEASFEPEWLQFAYLLSEKVMDEFFDKEERLFYYTSSKGEKLIARKKEVFDNVIPSTNSVMAHNLHKLGLYFENNDYLTLAEEMTARLKSLILTEPDYLTNWAMMAGQLAKPTAEIAIVGPGSRKLAAELQQTYLPNKVVAVSEAETDALPILTGKKTMNEKATIYVCYDRACQRPVGTVKEALLLIV